jgi:hypothetical protein
MGNEITVVGGERRELDIDGKREKRANKRGKSLEK